MQVQGAIALVTGANGGIGQYYIQGLQAAGASRIYAGARNPDSLKDIVATDPDRIIPIPLDITDEASVETAAKTYLDVNLLINNAGVGFNQRLVADINFDKVRSEIEVNYLGTLRMCLAFAPILRANGGGAIVNMLTILAKINFPLNASYCASKAAALLATQGLRAELASQKTLVVGVMPGTVDTGMSKDFPPPKVVPEEVVRAALQAVIDEVEDVYPGEQAQEMQAQLLQNPKAVEKWMAGILAS
ncbi:MULTISPECIES: SDR family oxidoreductase [unclassified Leptolyngbya]|uniref:SDR family oxidoreductase n=1 Tax=unclassified Leptolyngbya TaxID=2650499 RepID=UPI0016853E84|nr:MULTISPECIES: SDR family oxidoreductase [unclassified Leptolyngbya]MBD1909025.1 SDR family oxidoreductase [Leptolyngbya sp. FACHB-8]MBD2158075.1 SDR family oxidoreductase [Leptolyngbya sp. FACHB-16]